jgi:hypothetical protein
MSIKQVKAASNEIVWETMKGNPDPDKIFNKLVKKYPAFQFEDQQQRVVEKAKKIEQHDMVVSKLATLFVEHIRTH